MQHIDDTLDYKLHLKLHKLIRQQPYHIQKKLNSLLACCRTSTSEFVTVSTNGEKAVAHHVAMCGNNWACPVCTPIRMSKYASLASDAISMFKEQGYVGFMATLTIFNCTYHDGRAYTCKEFFDILKATYRKFISGGANYVKRNIFEKLGIKYFIRGCETTYGKNGWHPHYHIIYFLPKENLQKVAEYEKILAQKWRQCNIYCHKQITGEDIEQSMYYAKQNEHTGFFISKNPDNTIKLAVSGRYICGWGTDNELFSSYKKSHYEGQYTTHDLIESDDPELNQLYIDYTLATFRKNRVNFTKGLITQIQEWRKTHPHEELSKKKSENSTEKSMEIKLWLPRKKWSDIWFKSDDSNIPIIKQILEFIKLEDYQEKITELFKQHNLGPPIFKDPMKYITIKYDFYLIPKTA